MPQFDKLTFFTQIFWLTIIFFGFYFVTLQTYLPKIAAVIKTRKKKIDSGIAGIARSKIESVKVTSSLNTLLELFFNNSKSELNFNITKGYSWSSSPKIAGYVDSKFYKSFQQGFAILKRNLNKKIVFGSLN
jgi:hypothetical protein